MTRDTLVLGIDEGTSGPRPGWTEQDPDDWWTATREPLATLWSHGNSPGAITGVGLTGQMHSLALLDAAGPYEVGAQRVLKAHDD